MAKSPSHELGEYLGWFIENMMIEEIKPIANSLNLYLDHEHPRKARGGNKKVRWFDKNHNHHDLDIVLEKNGTDEKIGIPIAFIEMAWRRYTKHSKNKAQEIADSVTSIVEANKEVAPFYSTVLAGKFTQNSITQLKSKGFKVLYIPYEKVCEAFYKAVSIDIRFDEQTSEVELKKIFNRLNSLNGKQIELVREKLIELCDTEFKDFISKLKDTVQRKTTSIYIMTTFETKKEFSNSYDAIKFVDNLNVNNEKVDAKFYKIKVEVIFNNGDKVTGEFSSKENSINFIKNYN